MKFHNYIFLDKEKSFGDLSEAKIKLLQKKFIKELEKDKKVIVSSYTTLGLKVNSSVLLWFQSESIMAIQDLLNALMHTGLGKHIKITYSLFGIVRPTQYSPNSTSVIDTSRKGGKYLIIYPFTKTKQWYMLDLEKRKTLMKGHIEIGRRYPQITQLLLYSYGVDDNEFIVSYETDSLADFQTLIIELRSDKVREYTLNDTPIFTCIYRPLKEALNFL